MTSLHFTRRRKLEALENPDLIEDEELKKQVEEVKKKPCRSISECSSCIRFYTEHATYKEYVNKKKIKKFSKYDEMKKEIESTAWIQCDSLACRKWRKVPANDIDELAEKDWFCHLNPDPDFDSCLIAEEDTDKYDKMAETVGLNYIKSEYWEGCLVWAKMPGYCSWPAVVTRSIETDDICARDEEGYPNVYHVEYLGKSHTRGWIKRTALRMFSEGRNDEDLAKQSKSGCKKGKKSVNRNGSKTVFRKGETVEDALNEAIKLVPLTPIQRLDNCIFKYICIKDDAVKEGNKTVTTSPRGVLIATKSDPNKQPLPKPNNFKAVTKVLPQIKTTNSTAVATAPQCDSNWTHFQDTGNKKSELKPTGDENNEDITEEVPVSAVQFNYDNSLINKTKEERYCLDVEMYTKNEKAFEHDVLRFLMRNDIVYKGVPKILNVPITLFQIYLALHERGGYLEVCNRRQWMSVSREVTNTQNVGSSSNRIKAFYEKYLYPYELYIKGGDFSSYLKDHATKKTVTKKHNVTPSSTVPCVDKVNITDKEESSGNVVVPSVTDNFELLSECSVDIQEMLDNLEKDDSFCGLEDDVTAAKNKLGIDITFFDETPPEKDDVRTPSEFEEADLPLESAAQEVPHFEIMSNPMSDIESQEELIHEMQALQDGMDLIDNVLQQL